MSKKVTFIITLAFLLAIGAGTLMGVGFTRLAPPPPARRGPFDELHLSPQQRDQMQAIWSSVARFGSPGPSEGVRALQRERDDAIAALVSPERKQDYEKILKDFADKRDELNKERQKKFQDAQDRTKQILNADQLKKYEEILSHRGDRGDHGDHGRGPRPR